MAIRYDFFRNANSMDSNRERYHPRPTHVVTVGNENLLKELKELSGLSVGSVTAVLKSLNQVLARHLSNGDNVNLDGVGTFSVSLSAPETRTPTATRASSIKVKSVNFRCDQDLRDEVMNRATFVRDRVKTQSPDLDTHQLVVLLAGYFRKNRYLSRKTFQELTLLNESTAIRRLQMLREKGYITNFSGDDRHPLYGATPKLENVNA